MAGEAEVLVFGGARGRTFAAAFRDLRDGLSQYQYWHHSALNDLRARYRRSVLGEFWISINLAIFVLAIGFFYAAMLHLDPAIYVPHLLVGYTFWLLFSTLMAEGCQAFIMNGAILRQRRTPLSVIVLRNVDRAFLTLAHNLAVVAIGLPLLHVWPTWHVVLLAPALTLWWLNAVWLTLSLGIVCARFRDVPPAIVNITQLVFLVSPVLWRPDDVPQSLQLVADVNPLSHFIAIVRNPLLGTAVPIESWAVTSAATVVGWAIALVLLRHFRARVVYWV